MALPVNIQTGCLCTEAFLVFLSNKAALSELSFAFGCLHWSSCCCPSPPGVTRAPHKFPERLFPKGASQPCCQMCIFSKLHVSSNTDKMHEGCKINGVQRWMWLLCLSHFSLFYKAGRMYLTMSLMAPMGKKLLIRHFDLPPFTQEMWWYLLCTIFFANLDTSKHTRLLKLFSSVLRVIQVSFSGTCYGNILDMFKLCCWRDHRRR